MRSRDVNWLLLGLCLSDRDGRDFYAYTDADQRHV